MSGSLATTAIPLKQVASFITNSTQGASVAWHNALGKQFHSIFLKWSYTQRHTENVIGQATARTSILAIGYVFTQNKGQLGLIKDKR